MVIFNFGIGELMHNARRYPFSTDKLSSCYLVPDMLSVTPESGVCGPGQSWTCIFEHDHYEFHLAEFESYMRQFVDSPVLWMAFNVRNGYEHDGDCIQQYFSTRDSTKYLSISTYCRIYEKTTAFTDFLRHPVMCGSFLTTRPWNTCGQNNDVDIVGATRTREINPTFAICTEGFITGQGIPEVRLAIEDIILSPPEITGIVCDYLQCAAISQLFSGSFESKSTLR